MIKEADKESSITIINKDDYIADCNTLNGDNSTYHKTTTDMMETHLKEVENLLHFITIADKQHVSNQLSSTAKPGIFYD